VKLGHAVLGYFQAEKVGGGEGLDDPPGDVVVRELIIKKPLKEFLRGPLQADPPHEAPEADVHVNQAETGIYAQKVEVVDPQNFGAVGVDDLLVQKGFLEQNLPFLQDAFYGIALFQGIDPKGVPDFLDPFPGKTQQGLLVQRTVKNTHDERVEFSYADDEVENPTPFPVGRIQDFFSEDLA